MSPVDLHLLTWGRFKTNKRLSVFYLSSHLLKVIPHNGDLSIKPLVLKALENYRGFYHRVLLKELIDQIPERVQFGGFRCPFTDTLLRVLKVLFYGVSAQSDLPGDASFCPPEVFESVDLENGSFINHGCPP
jgi:hypothetical protein